MLQSCCLYKLLISNAWREESLTKMKDLGAGSCKEGIYEWGWKGVERR